MSYQDLKALLIPTYCYTVKVGEIQNRFGGQRRQETPKSETTRSEPILTATAEQLTITVSRAPVPTCHTIRYIFLAYMAKNNVEKKFKDSLERVLLL